MTRILKRIGIYAATLFITLAPADFNGDHKVTLSEFFRKPRVLLAAASLLQTSAKTQHNDVLQSVINFCNSRGIAATELIFTRSPRRKQAFKALKAEGYSYSEIASVFLSKPAPLIKKQSVQEAVTT